jgi:multidrug transporter EmrE-like cation transporter
MKKERENIKRTTKLFFGCMFLIMAGTTLGFLEAIHFVKLGIGLYYSIWIPITFVILLIIGMVILLYREDQLNEERREGLK